MKIVLASGNPGKLHEMRALLSDLAAEVLPQSQFQVPEAAETGLTFVENAILKARNAAKHTGLPAIADDSGIAVAALGGAPGIYSARYAGEGATDEDNLQKLLADTAELPEEKRAAAFHCVVVFLKRADDPTPLIAQGIWTGELLTAPRGKNGFGYDPIFWVPDYACASAELAPEIKNAISHRAQALGQLVELMSGRLTDQTLGRKKLETTVTRLEKGKRKADQAR